MTQCHRCLLYTRILVYMGTISLHVANIFAIHHGFQGEPMKNENIRQLKDMQIYYFTVWNFTFQVLYAAFAIICDWKTLTNASEKKPALPSIVTRFRENMFSVLVWPSSFMVTTYFWAFYFYDRELFYPSYADSVVSLLSNHIMHTLILPIAVIEIVLYPRKKPETHFWRLLCLYATEAFYFGVIYLVHQVTGLWPYPILYQLYGTIYLPAFLIFTGLYLTFFYYGQYCSSAFVVKCWQKVGEKYCTACKK